MNLLIVDDIPTNRKLLRVMLEPEGHTAFEAADGTEALQILARESIDAVISDILMPNMDGYRLCYEVRKDPRFSHLPFIVYTATYTSPNDEKLSLDIGADRFIRKPASSKDIIGELKAVIATRRRSPAGAKVPIDEMVLMKEYSERLVAKLEERNIELEQRIRLAALSADVTAAALRELREVKAALDEHAIVAITDPKGKITYANDKFCAISKYSRAELLGQDHRIINSGFHPTEFIRNIWQTISDGRVWKGEIKNKAKDGTFYWVDTTIVPYLGEDGKPNQYIAIRADITERRRAEEARTIMESKFRGLVEQSLTGIYVIQDERFVYVNPKMADIFGYSEAELTAAPVVDFVYEEDRTLVDGNIRRRLAGTTQSIRYALRARRKDGSIIHIEAHGARSEYNDRPSVLGTLLDVTERKRADEQTAEALRELNDLKAALDEHAIVAITDAKGKITYVNDKFCAISKYSREELLGQDHRIINSGFHPKEFIRNIWQTINDGRVWKGEIKNQAKDGAFYWVDTTIVPYLSEDGQPVQYIAIRADITERKRFEQALQETNVKLESAKSAAEKANLAKSDFLSNMSHELRSPLNAILGFAQLMESASPVPTASQAARIAQILQAGWYLLNLIDEILDLAVIDSGTVPLSKESVSLPELLSECQAMMEPQAQQRGVRMSFPRFDSPIFVMADRTRLKQILINLLSNAIKYNREQGTVVVEWTVSAPERIRVSVRDTGAGLPPEKLAQLFQPFNRLGQETGSVAGTGIGLVVSKRLAELMEGALGAESIVGVGSVFWCELISAAAPQLNVPGIAAAASVPPQLPVGSPQRTLLYIEDNPANMMLVEQLIAERPDIRLATAVNGTLGIELARATQPTVILMDINLPGISGIKALKILRQDPATAHIPVVALSANAMPRDVAKGLEAEFFRYLTKPIKIKEFMDTLNAALEFAGKTSLSKHLTQDNSYDQFIGHS